MKMQLRSTCLLISITLITGCSNDSNSDQVITTPNKQLKFIDIYSSTDSGKTLAQTRHDALSYQNGRLAKIDSFTNNGKDAVWGTSDDSLTAIVKCSFSGQVSSSMRDPRLEFTLPSISPSSVTLEILMIILGLESKHASCAIGYQNDLSFTEDLFIPKLFDVKDQDKPFVSYKWQSLQLNNKHSGSEGTIQSLIFSDVVASSNKTTFNYSGSDTIIDPIKHQIHRYTFEKDKIKTETVYQYDGDVNTALAQINTLTVISSSQIERTSTLIRTCTTATFAINSSQLIETLDNGIVVQKDFLSAGADGKGCTADDFIVSREKYNYQ